MDDLNEEDYEEVGLQKKTKKQLVNQNSLHHTTDPTKTIGSLPSNPMEGRQSTQTDMSASSASARYALSRFPFPPVITTFNSELMTVKRFKEEIAKHFLITHQISIEILNCPSSPSKWPDQIAGEGFIFPSSPSIPPQLSLIVENVHVRISLSDLTNELKALYPEVKYVMRIAQARTHITEGPAIASGRKADDSSSAPSSNNVINYRPMSSDFPPLPSTTGSQDGALMSKIDVLMDGLSKVSESLVLLCEANEDVKECMVEKNKHDVMVDKEIST